MLQTFVGGKDPKLSTSGKLPKCSKPQTEDTEKPNTIESR